MNVNKHKCPQNHRCPAINVCPVGAIEQNNHALPTIDLDLCVQCGKCVDYCPMRAIQEN